MPLMDGLIRRLDIAEERVSELEDTTIETPQTEKEKKKTGKKPRKRIFNNCGTITEGITYM